MNKYQEALDTLTDWFHSYTDANGLVHEKHIDEDYQKAKETLQELVDAITPICDMNIETKFLILTQPMYVDGINVSKLILKEKDRRLKISNKLRGRNKHE